MEKQIVKSRLKGFGIAVGALLVLAGLFLGMFELQRFIAVKQENIRREAFEATRSFNEGKIQELSRYRLQYIQSDSPEEKRAIASTVRHNFAAYDRSSLSPELKLFLEEINR